MEQVRRELRAEKEKLFQCVPWEEAAAAAGRMEADTANPPLFSSKPAPTMKAPRFFCSNTAGKATWSHGKGRGAELQLGTVPCSSAW